MAYALRPSKSKLRPLISILIPCYNAEQWVGKAIKSALGQTWPEKEVVVVDDGSIDTSSGIIRGFGDQIRWETGPNRGGNVARNRLLELARGDWVQFLDADDYLKPEKIAFQLKEASGGMAADVIYSRVLIDEDSNLKASQLNREFDIYSQWIAWHLPQTGGCLWRRSALEEIGGWNQAIPCCQEHELYLRALQLGLRFKHTPTPLAVYRIWSEETVCRRDPRKVVHVRTQLIENMCAWLRETGRWSEQHAATAGRACFEMARTLAKFDIREAAEYHRSMKDRGLIRLSGPAAPATYRIAYWIGGFSAAERLACLRRVSHAS